MVTTIEINGLKVFARHGVNPQERVVGNVFEVTLHLRYPFEEAARNDTLHTTIDYGDIIKIVKREMSEPSALLENVAWRIRKTLLVSYPKITGGMIKVIKADPPLSVDVDNVAARIEW